MASAVTAIMRQPGDKPKLSGYILTGSLAIAVAAAVAVGVGVIVFHHRTSGKSVNAADRRRSAPVGSHSEVSIPASAHPGVVGPYGPGKRGKAPSVTKVGRGSKAGSSAGGDKVMAATVVTHEIVSSASNRCVDVTGGKAFNGASLEIWDCNGGAPQQRWTFTGGTMRSLGMCMTAAGPSASGTPIQIARCNGSPAQLFGLTSAHDIVHSGTSQCIDVQDKRTGNGTRLQLWKCAGTSNQKWRTT